MMDDSLFERWLRLAAVRVAAERVRLTELDSAIGDGDHGINLDRGFAALVARMDAGEIDGGSGPALVTAAGRTIIGTVGGASGALYGRALMRVGEVLATAVADAPDIAEHPDAWRPGGDDTADSAIFAVALEAAVESIMRLGRSQTGEKTMLDALAPAATALRREADAGQSLGAAVAAAAAAAEAGAAATIPMLATKGRASYLGERSIGHLDPGAVSSAILLRALADAAAPS